MGLFDFLKQNKPEMSPEVQETMQKVSSMAFPGGSEQMEEETGQLHALLRGHLNRDEAKRLLTRTKALLIIAQDQSEERITHSILAATGGKLTQHEARLVFQFLTGTSGPLHSGGDGSSRDRAVVINATSSITGIRAEYEWIEARYGKQDIEWTVKTRFHGGNADKAFETFVIQLRDGSERTIHFDISLFYKRF